MTQRNLILPGAVWWASAGFGLGVSAGAAYLVLGGEYIWNIPRWANVVFYPGFQAGFQVNHWGLSNEASKVVGVLVVGLAYAVLAALLGLLWFALNHRRQADALPQNSD